jgi:phytanoyl-CoA hydroxylase
MNAHITDEQAAFYQENGYIFVENFLTPEELQTWRDTITEAVAARGGYKLADKSHDWGDDYYNHVFTQAINLWEDQAPVRALVTDSRIGEMAAKLAGVSGMRLYQDQALFKEPWGNPTWWHLDGPYWAFPPHQALTMWIALDDATQQNGCMYFQPGTHKMTTLANSETPSAGSNMGDFFKVYPNLKGMDAIPVALKAGSASFHSALLAHAAGGNMTPRRRRAMTLAYMPTGSTWNGNQGILTAEDAATLKVGDSLDNDKWFPLVYQG